jgi:hypothetical protein
MANTTNYNWETPDDTDLVKDGAAAIRTLGSSIDTTTKALNPSTTLGDIEYRSSTANTNTRLAIGTNGQILSVVAGVPAWVANDVGDITEVAAGTGISGGGTSGSVTITNSMATAIDAKGDLVAGTGADAFARLAVGTNDQVLTADSTAATGLKWSTPSAGGSSFVGCRLYKTTNQTMATGTWVTITYDSESFDTNSFHDNSTNTSRITIPSGKAGYYLINARVNIEANATGARLARFTVNGNELFAGIEVAGSSAAGCKYTMSTIQNLSVGDYVELLCLHNVGSNLDFVGNSGVAHNEFSVEYLGA